MSEKQKNTQESERKRVNSFAFYSNFLDAARLLNQKERLAFYDSMVEYAIEGVEPKLVGKLALLFIGVKPTLDASRRKALNIQKRWNDEQSKEPCKNTNPDPSIDTDKSSLKDKDKDKDIGGGGGEKKAPPSLPDDQDYIGDAGSPPPVAMIDLLGYGSNHGISPEEVRKFWNHYAGFDWRVNKAGTLMSRNAVFCKLNKWREDSKIFAARDAKAGGYQLRTEVPVEDTRPDIHAVPTALRPATSLKEMYGGEDPNAGLEE